MIGGFARHPVQARVKAAADPVLAVILLVIVSPVMLAIAVWILLESGRPVIFRQHRAGLHGQTFGLLKFRTMVPDAIEVGRRLALSEDPFGLVERDPRITRSGRFLRRTGLDELPQLANVVRRRMSLVGPRPDLVEQAAHYTEEEARRLAVRPGITGWSQIHGREDQTWPERFAYDAWYLQHWSLRLDVVILLRTFRQFLRPEPVPVADTLNIERAHAGRTEGPEA